MNDPRRDAQLEMTEVPLFALGAAKARVMSALKTTRDAVSRELLTAAVADLDEAQRYLIYRDSYPYGRERR